jgi:multimeric flavodoxin WrbA
MKKANAFIFATPVYFWNVSGLMKMFFDRLLPLLKFVKEGERMRIKSRVEGKNCAIIVVQEEERSGKISIPLLFFKRNLEDFGLKMIGKLFVYGALLPGDVNKNKNAIKRAYLLGRRIAQYAQ